MTFRKLSSLFPPLLPGFPHTLHRRSAPIGGKLVQNWVGRTVFPRLYFHWTQRSLNQNRWQLFLTSVYCLFAQGGICHAYHPSYSYAVGTPNTKEHATSSTHCIRDKNARTSASAASLACIPHFPHTTINTHADTATSAETDHWLCLSGRTGVEAGQQDALLSIFALATRDGSRHDAGRGAGGASSMAHWVGRQYLE